jgi:hypothetical protein
VSFIDPLQLNHFKHCKKSNLKNSIHLKYVRNKDLSDDNMTFLRKKLLFCTQNDIPLSQRFSDLFQLVSEKG